MKKNALLKLLFIGIAFGSCSTPRHDAVRAPHKLIKVELSGTGNKHDSLIKSLQDGYLNFYDGKLGMLTDGGSYLEGTCKYQEAADIWEINIASFDKLLLAVSSQRHEGGKEWTILEGNTVAGTGVKLVLEYDPYYQ